MVCADNTVVIPMRACNRGKSEARGTRSAEGAPCEGWLDERWKPLGWLALGRGARGRGFGRSISVHFG